MSAPPAAPLLLLLLLLHLTRGVEVNMEDRVEVYREDVAQINCIFSSEEGPGALTIQWFYVTRGGEKQSIYLQDAIMQHTDRGTQFSDRISVNGTSGDGRVVLIINDVQLEDEVEFICIVKSLTHEIGEGRTKLKVFETPDLPTIEGVQRGISVNEDTPKIGVCEAKNGFPKPNITWYRNNTPLRPKPDEVKVDVSSTVESSGLFSVHSQLSMTVVKEDKDAMFYCEVSYLVPGGTRMTETKHINITVFYPSTAVSMWVESPKGEIKEGDTVELQCRGNGNNPSAIISMKRAEADPPAEDSQTMVLADVTRLDSGVYVCTSLDTDSFTEISGNTTVFVNYLEPAVITPGKVLDVAQGEELKATCNALSSLQTSTVWFRIADNDKRVQVSKGHTLLLTDVMFDTAGVYECVVTVPGMEGMESKQELHVHVSGPPEITEPESTELEEMYDSSVSLSCHVRGFPAPTVSWSTSDGKPLAQEPEVTTNDSVLSTVLVKVSSDITAFCNASNEHGSASVAFNIKATTHTTKAATKPTTPTIPPATVQAATAKPQERVKKEGSGVIIAVIIIIIMLLAILGSVLYFLFKKGKICGRAGKQDLTKEKSNNKDIVVEMKSDNTEEAVLLGVNGDKQPTGNQ